MKKFYCLLLPLLFSFLLSAQNWAPYQPNDSIVHFLSKDTVYTGLGGQFQFSHFISPIQSMVPDSIKLDSNYRQITFKRGINMNSFRMDTNQMVKGQILGDSLKIYADSSLFYTIDPSGFRLFFPHSYPLSKRWILGKSADYRLEATVDSIFYDTIPGFGSDSMAQFTISVSDSNQIIQNNHPFHRATVVISKKHGLVQTINFTELEYKHGLNLFNLSQRLKEIEFESISTRGDEYSLSFFDNRYSTGTVDIRSYKVLRDTVIANQKVVTIERKRQQKYPPPPSTMVVDTFNLKPDSFRVNGRIKSLIIEDSCLSGGCYEGAYKAYGICYDCSSCYSCQPSELISYRTSTTILSPGTFLMAEFNQMFLAGVEEVEIFGVDTEQSSWGHNGYANLGQSKSIGVIKRGPPPIITSLTKNTFKERGFQIVPNPVSEHLHVKLDQPVHIRKIEIYKLNGQKLLSKTNNFEAGISVSEFPSGLYFLRIVTPKGSLSAKFIVR